MSENQQDNLTNETIDEDLETKTTKDDIETEEEAKDINNEEVSDTTQELAQEENLPSMDDFEEQIDKSFHKVNVGDIIKGSVVGVSDTEIILDLGSYAEGMITANEFSGDPNFSLKDGVSVGDEISAEVIKDDDGEGNILLSKKRADYALAWEELKDHMDNETELTVKITQSVKGGVLTYVDGIRGFIPASQLSIRYVENLDEWIDKEVEAIVITVEESKNRLVLSSKQVEIKNQKEIQQEKLASLEKGAIVKGTVDSIVPYGAFINLGQGLSGLVHISQLSNKFVKSPNEIVKEGQEVEAKVLDIKDGKINLSMKALDETSASPARPTSKPRPKFNKRSNSKPQRKAIEFTSDEEATTSLGDILKDLNLD